MLYVIAVRMNSSISGARDDICHEWREVVLWKDPDQAFHVHVFQEDRNVVRNTSCLDRREQISQGASIRPDILPAPYPEEMQRLHVSTIDIRSG